MQASKKIVFKGGPLDETCRRVSVDTEYFYCYELLPLHEQSNDKDAEVKTKKLTYKKWKTQDEIEIFKLVEDESNNKGTEAKEV